MMTNGFIGIFIGAVIVFFINRQIIKRIQKKNEEILKCPRLNGLQPTHVILDELPQAYLAGELIQFGDVVVIKKNHVFKIGTKEK